MRNLLLLTGAVLIVAAGCARKAEEPAAATAPESSTAPAAQPPAGAAGPRATVTLQDGSKVSGTVTASTPSELTLAGDDGIGRTIPTSKVKSVQYGETASAKAPAAAPAAAAPAKRELIPSHPAAPPAAAAPPAPAAPAAPDPKTIVLPAGTEIAVRAGETIDSKKATEGQSFAADVAKNVAGPGGEIVIPKGADARIVIRSLSQGGKIRGASDLALDLQSVRINGRNYEVDTTDLTQKGKSGVGANKRTAEYTGGGAALGAVIGAIAGGGKGAAIGAGAGAGAGALTQVLTRGSIKVPVETVLTFKLERPLRIVER